jgi:hypothetical protein
MSSDNPLCIFCCATNRIIDFPAAGESSAEAIARLTEEYGAELQAMRYNDATQHAEEALRTEPREITPEHFNDMLNIMLPVGWVVDGNGQSFKMSERIDFDITSIYVQLNNRCFTFNDRVKLPHADCCAKVFHSEAYRAPSALGDATADLQPER